MRTLLSVVLLTGLSLAAPAQTADEKKISVSYLQGLQQKDGGFRPTAKAERSSLRGTSASLRALKYFGGQAKDVPSCKTFVLSCRDAASGGFADTPGGKADVVLTAVGLMALVELKVPTALYEEAAIAFMTRNAKQFEDVRMAAAGLEAVGKAGPKNREWLGRLARMQNTDGTFGKGADQVRDTGGAAACVLRLGGKVKDKAAILNVLNEGQRKDGGFGRGATGGSDLETSYRVLRTFVMLKAKPKRADDLRAFVGKCRNRDGGYGTVPGAPSSAGGTYFASIILHWLDGK